MSNEEHMKEIAERCKKEFQELIDTSNFDLEAVRKLANMLMFQDKRFNKDMKGSCPHCNNQNIRECYDAHGFTSDWGDRQNERPWFRVRDCFIRELHNKIMEKAQ